MPSRTPPQGQLDVPLVWGHQREGAADGRGEAEHVSSHLTPFGGAWRLWLGVLGDACMVMLAVAFGWALVVALGAELGSPQLVLAGLAGLEAASVLALGCLWGWRATPGMLMAGVCFSRPIPWGRVCRLWFFWLLSLFLAGLPLLLRRRGESAAERLADGVLSLRSLPVGA